MEFQPFGYKTFIICIPIVVALVLILHLAYLIGNKIGFIKITTFLVIIFICLHNYHEKIHNQNQLRLKTSVLNLRALHHDAYDDWLILSDCSSLFNPWISSAFYEYVMCEKQKGFLHEWRPKLLPRPNESKGRSHHILLL